MLWGLVDTIQFLFEKKTQENQVCDVAMLWGFTRQTHPSTFMPLNKVIFFILWLNKVIFFILWVGGELMVCFLAKTPCNSPILCIFSCWFQIWNPFLPVIKNEKAQGHQRFFLKIMTFFCIFAIYWPFFKIPGWNLGGIFFISHL